MATGIEPPPTYLFGPITAGGTVVVVEHDLDLITSADWMIEPCAELLDPQEEAIFARGGGLALVSRNEAARDPGSPPCRTAAWRDPRGIDAAFRERGDVLASSTPMPAAHSKPTGAIAIVPRRRGRRRASVPARRRRDRSRGFEHRRRR
jgi:hypothetical protein